MYLTKHVFKSFSIEISVGILYFVFQYSFVGIVFTVNQSIYETTKFLFELWSLQSFIIMKCWKIINDSTAPFKSSNRLQKNTPTASFLHSSSLPRSSLWRATLVPSCNKKKSSFFFCLRRYFLKRLSVSSSVLFSFLQFLTFSRHSSIHFPLHLSLRRQKVNEMKKCVSHHERNLLLFYLHFFVGVRRMFLRVSPIVGHAQSSCNLNATMIQHVMPLFDAPLFVSKSYMPQNRLVFPPGTATYDNLSCVHTLATRCVPCVDRRHFFLLNSNFFFAGIVYITYLLT